MGLIPSPINDRLTSISYGGHRHSDTQKGRLEPGLNDPQEERALKSLAYNFLVRIPIKMKMNILLQRFALL
jgi:hypothetical protein